ncbi:FimV/HubP family polar landmark protein [Dyella choica]|uniref:Fimbrial protein FimV n=1 Tax=Dyella choica TaxID=1927959 RepID=A0A3S0RMD6_9GAMM|nr:FimV/HubP family polar landmark protein [Dyella choica]RUL78301.1 fimbrial protein FimV [Dyella choica]
MNRSLKLSILLALALGSGQAAAVELGQAHVKSALGQPLLVDIPVTQATPAELQSLSAQLASNDAFSKAGGQRPSIPLQFNVVDENGHKVIRVTSSNAVDDPYLDLLVEVNSSTGSSVREFAILLDPPTKVEQAAASSTPARHRAPAGGTSAPANTASAPAPHRAAPARAAAAEVKNGQIGPVEKGATLSHIAAEVTPSGVNVDQMMLALKSANPNAFYRDNINALKAGVVLRVPSRDDALATAAAVAAATVQQQNADWRNGTSTPVAVAAGGTRENTSVAPTANSNADRLALTPPGSEGQAAGGTSGKGGANAAVRQQLQRSQETLASLQQQSSELKSRLKDLEDLNTKNQRLLALKDNQIADLQKQLAEARKEASKPAATVPAAPAPTPAPVAANKPVAPPAPVSEPHPAAAPAPTVAAASSAAKPVTPPAAAAGAEHGVVTTPLNAPAKPKPTVQPHHVPTPALEEQPWYMETWAWAAGAGVIVLGLVGVLLSRRGKSTTKPPKTAVPSKGGSLADRFGTAEEGDQPGSDPDQDELLDQLAEQPDDIGLHLELVSLYYTRRDVEHFEASAEAMHAHITDPNQPEWQDVVHMGRDLAPGHPLFAEVAADATSVREPVHHFDLDSYGHPPAAEPAAPAKSPAPQPAKVSEYHFDFDLTPHQPEPVTKGAAPSIHEPEEEPVSTWKFDEELADEPQAGHAAHPGHTAHAGHTEHDAFGELHDDPVDTKLDLARAYLDMGDPDGARAMLEEVIHEGTQMQRDMAKQLLEKIS